MMMMMTMMVVLVLVLVLVLVCWCAGGDDESLSIFAHAEAPRLLRGESGVRAGELANTFTIMQSPRLLVTATSLVVRTCLVGA